MTEILLIHAIILCIGLSCEPRAWAKNENHPQGSQPEDNTFTVAVEAETHFEITAYDNDGGGVRGNLLDNLNLPLAARKITVVVEQTDDPDRAAYTFDAETDENGYFSIDFELPGGAVDFRALFQGADGYRPAEYAGRMRVRHDCKTWPELDSAGDNQIIWGTDDKGKPVYLTPQGESVRFYIKPAESECRMPFRHAYMVTYGSRSVRLDVPGSEGQVMAELDLDIQPSDLVLVQVADLSRRDFAFYSQSRSFYVRSYAHLFDDGIVSVDAYHKAARIRLSDDLVKHHIALSDLSQSLRLKICDARESCVYAGNTYQAPDENELLFEIPDMADGCGYQMYVSMNDQDVYTLRHFDGCIHQTILSKYRLIIPFGIIGILIVIYIVYRVMNRLVRKYRNRMPEKPDNYKQTHDVYEKLPLEMGIPEDAGKRKPDHSDSLLVCVDDETGKPVPPSQVSVKTDESPAAVEKWPLYIKDGAWVEIRHPDYMSFNGRIHHNPKQPYHVVRLKTRRRYVIECFLCVYTFVTGKKTPWGKETPRQLISYAQKHHLSRAKDIERICHRIESAVFDDERLTDELMLDIREKCKEITT